MKFLVILLLLNNHQPEAAKLVGSAETVEACQQGAVEYVKANPKLLEAPVGYVVRVLCAPVPPYDENDQPTRPKSDGTVTKL